MNAERVLTEKTKGIELDGLLEKKILEKRETTYRIISKSVTEYQFIVPFDLPDDERAEVGQIFSIQDKNENNSRNLTFLARVTDIQHAANYDGNWDTTIKGTQFFDQDQIFNRVMAEPLGCVHDGKFNKSSDNTHQIFKGRQSRKR